MDLENENKLKDYNLVDIKDLQANLFPLFPKLSGYFSNYLLKSQSEAEDVEENVLRIKPVGSKDLFAINREGNFQIQPARWPTECQVLSEPVDHITSIPPQPEPYYVTTGAEIQPKPSGEEFGIVVYQYCPISAVNYFSRSSVGGSKYLLSTNICPEENSLKFESRFESGNLARAIRLTPNYYELHLRSDLYTSRYMQWFYFRVTNMRKNFLYRFSIVNFTKDGSLYNSGLRPLMYSEKDSQLHSIGWRRCGEQITYFCNENVTEDGEDQQMTYTLTFTVTFPHEGDTVYFASCYPYTYTNLQNYLWELSNHPIKSTYTTLRLLCKSLAGNNVDYITITSPSEEDDVKKKRAIVITARVHPGETPSSWMMKGIIDFLTSDCAPAKELRDKFIFKIVPMLNPDGVVVGNNRCSLSGKDLNRQYRTVMREAYPSIWYTKLMVRRLIEECGVSMYCDLHGHSRKHNIFIYGCENRRQNEKRLQEQIFPLMLHKNASEKFSFEDCSFKVQKGKEGTGRIVMWMMGITNSYTLEASFAGSSLGSRQSTHFSVQDYEQMGKSFCQTLLDFYDAEPRKEQLRMKILNRLCEGGSCADEPTNIQLSDYSSDAGSSSDVEEGGDFNYGYKIKVPPPSPNVPSLNIHLGPNSKLQKKHQNTRNKTNVTKNNLTNRRIAPMRKTNLTLSLSESKLEYCSETSSDSEAENIRPNKDITDGRNIPRNKKIRKKKIQLVTNKFSSIGGRLRNIMDMVTRTWSDLNLLFSKLDDLKVENIKLSERTKILESAIALLDTDEARQETGLTMIRSYFKQNISNRSLEKATEDDNQFYSMKTSRIRADIFKDIDLNDKWLIDYDDSGLIESDEFSDEVSTEFCLPDTMDTIVAVTLEKAMAFNNFLDQLSNSVLPAKQITESYKGEVNQMRSISALEILPPENLNADLRKRSRTPHLKFFADKRNGLDVDEQLSMVQQRLMALKYKIWYGNGDGDQPISWGNLGNSLVDPAISDKDSKKLVKKKRNNLQRKNTTKGKPKNDVKRKASAKKNVNNLKRQQAIDIQPPVKTIFVRKSQSFNDIASAHSKKPPKLKSYASCDDKESKSDSKTKKTGKLPEKGKNKSFKR